MSHLHWETRDNSLGSRRPDILLGGRRLQFSVSASEVESGPEKRVTTSFHQFEVTGAPFPVFCCPVSVFTNTVSADSENTVVKYDPKSFSVVLGISHVIPKGSQVSLTAKKNSLLCFPKDIEGIVPLIGVRVISNIWLMIYCLEETFICGSVARPRQT